MDAKHLMAMMDPGLADTMNLEQNKKIAESNQKANRDLLEEVKKQTGILEAILKEVQRSR